MKKIVFCKSFHIIAVFAFFMLVFSCKREPIFVEEIKGEIESRELSILPPPPAGFYSMTYTDHPTLTFAQYCLKARKNSLMTGINASFGSAIIGQRSTYRASLPNWKKPEFDYFLTQLASISYYVKNFTYTDGKQYAIFRNWTYSTSKPKPFIIRSPQDMQFSTTSPFYYTGNGYISCNLDPNFSISFGTPQKIISSPSTVKFTAEWNTTNPGHIGIKPVNPNITQSNLQAQMDLILVEPAQ